MCWFSRKKPEYRIATEDITVYKTSNHDYFFLNQFKSDVVRYIYNMDEKQKEIDLKISEHHTLHNLFQVINYFTIQKGYHSYGINSTLIIDRGNFTKKERENLKCNAPDLIKINSKDIYISSYNMQIGVFIIPKGSKYFVNEHLDYISSSIIFKYKLNVGRILNDLESKKEYLMFDLEKQFYHKYATQKKIQTQQSSIKRKLRTKFKNTSSILNAVS